MLVNVGRDSYCQDNGTSKPCWLLRFFHSCCEGHLAITEFLPFINSTVPFDLAFTLVISPFLWTVPFVGFDVLIDLIKYGLSSYDSVLFFNHFKR